LPSSIPTRDSFLFLSSIPMGSNQSVNADAATARFCEWAKYLWAARGAQRVSSYARLDDSAAAALAKKEELPAWAMQKLCGGDVRSVAWSPDGAKLATGDSAKKLTIFDAASGATLLEATCGGRVYSVAWSPEIGRAHV